MHNRRAEDRAAHFLQSQETKGKAAPNKDGELQEEKASMLNRESTDKTAARYAVR